MKTFNIQTKSFINEKTLDSAVDFSKISGDVTEIYGDVTEIYGDTSKIFGNVTGIYGDVTGISGYVTGISGDVTGIRLDIPLDYFTIIDIDQFGFTVEDRKVGIKINL
jgi:hypothetical protein